MRPLLYLLPFILLATLTPAFSQTDIFSIDGVYVERDTVIGKDRKTSTYSFRLNELAVVDNDVLVFDIPGFDEYLERSNTPLTSVTLLIEQESYPEFPAYIENAESGTIRFQFIEADLTASHRELLYKKRGAENKRLRLGINSANKVVLNFSPKAQFYFSGVKRWEQFAYFLIGGFSLLVILLIFLGPSLLKDSLPAEFQSQIPNPNLPTEAARPRSFLKILFQFRKAQQNRSFSFSKTQLCFWTLIVIGSFIYITAFTGDQNPINTTALILLGISAATTAAGGLINERQEQAATPTTQTATLTTTPGTSVTATTQQPPSNDPLSFLESRTSTGSFFFDILSDNQGLNLHRVQSFAFNILFGLIFIRAVAIDYTMPTFGDVELLLLGLSNGTYAFLKTTENK